MGKAIKIKESIVMTKKHELNQQDAVIEQIISQLDLSGMTQEKLFGQDGIIENHSGHYRPLFFFIVKNLSRRNLGMGILSASAFSMTLRPSLAM